jgi:hypothetical protein
MAMSECIIFWNQLKKMHHAWSEVQHSVIYKTDKPAYSVELPGRFVDLATMINTCDEILGDFSIEPTLPLIEMFRPEVTPADFGRVIKEMQRVVTEFETNNTPDSERYDKPTKFLEKHESDLAKLSEVSVGNVETNLELGGCS